MQPSQARTTREPGPGLVALALALLVLVGGLLRVRTTLDDPGFSSSPPEGLLRSDPALLAYFTQRIAECGGIPPDFGAEPRIEHPLALDVPALFPVGPEFVVAGLWKLCARGLPLYRACLYASSLAASLLVIGVYLLARELTGRRSLGLAAALFAALLPANYRTLGFLFVGEDWSMPLFVLHLGLAARACRVGSRTSALVAALPLLASLGSWHAASFFLALEALALCAVFWTRGRNAFAHAPAWCALALVAVGGLAIPVLRHTRFVLSLPMALAFGLAVAGVLERRGASRPVRRVGLVGTVAACLLGASFLGSGDYSHVFGLLGEKLANFGVLPDDPAALPAEVRLMWQGPFATLAPSHALWVLGLGCAGFAWALSRLWRHEADERIGALCWLALGSLPLAWLVERTLVLPALLAAPLCAAACVRWRASWIGGALLAQALGFSIYLSGYVIPWYQPLVRQQELAGLVRALPALVPEGEAVATDFINGPALLLQTRRPILYQPKWEPKQSRERIERFLEMFFHGTPQELSRVLREEYRCRYLLVDRVQLGLGCAYAAGIPEGREPPPDSPAARLCSTDAAALESIPGYKLLWRSSPALRQSNGRPSDFYRLFELLPEAR
ncbi:MAG: hypothetical protein IPJ19_09155 [Planctomycetes bacterium]|nr:hypothetical protein [Planctomycetota bacterium]